MNIDPWDDWEPGRVFNVKGSWHDTVSGKGSL
jgi:hypothetical protein